MYGGEMEIADHYSFFNGVDDQFSDDVVVEYSRTVEPEAGRSVVAVKDGECMVVTVESESAVSEYERLNVWGVVSA